MTDLYGSYFTYIDISSEDMGGLVLANAGTTRISEMAGVIGGLSFFNGKNKKKYIIADDYSSSALSFDVDIVKCDLSPIDPYETRDIQRWLFNRSGFGKLYIDTGYESDRYKYLNCRFVNPKKLEAEGIIYGYTATIECDSDMLWEDPTTESFNLTGTTNTISVNVDSDRVGYTYPKVRIRVGSSGGDIYIINGADDTARLTKFVGLVGGSMIVIDSAINHVNDNFYSKFETRNFPRLLSGSNNISVLGDVASIEYEWQNRRYL